ncbi:unnamed protein product [Diamesa serratosioi]
MRNDFKICRVCLSSESSDKFKSVFEENSKYAKIIFLLSGVVILEANKLISALICMGCETNLSNISTIRQNCRTADKCIKSLGSCIESKLTNSNKNETQQCSEVVVVDDDDDDEEVDKQQDVAIVNTAIVIDKIDIGESDLEEFEDIPLCIERNQKLNSNSTLLNKAKKSVQGKTGIDGSKCTICKTTYRSNYALLLHLRSYHEKSQFSCVLCCKPFISKADLSRHIRVHTGERPYSCFFCRRNFNISSNCLRHMRLIHNYNIAQ